MKIFKRRALFCFCAYIASGGQYKPPSLLRCHTVVASTTALGFPKESKKAVLHMKNYWASDYALNRKSTGIVYRFADGVVEISLQDYLRENPDKTEADFQQFKAISDEIYFEQFSRDKAYLRRCTALHTQAGLSTPSAEEVLETSAIQRELEQLQVSLEKFLRSGLLTEIQRRRFSLYCLKGLSTRQIARKEGVSQCSVWESLQACAKKFEKFLSKYPVTPANYR